MRNKAFTLLEFAICVAMTGVIVGAVLIGEGIMARDAAKADQQHIQPQEQIQEQSESTTPEPEYVSQDFELKCKDGHCGMVTEEGNALPFSIGTKTGTFECNEQ